MPPSGLARRPETPPPDTDRRMCYVKAHCRKSDARATFRLEDPADWCTKIMAMLSAEQPAATGLCRQGCCSVQTRQDVHKTAGSGSWCRNGVEVGLMDVGLFFALYVFLSCA